MEKLFRAVAAIALSLSWGSNAYAATTIFDFDAAQAVGAEGHLDNTVLTRYLGPGAGITSIAFAVTVTAISETWLTDLSVRFGTSDDSRVNFKPGYAMLEPGTAFFKGEADLKDMGMDFHLDDDGILKVEFIDTFNYLPEPHGLWTGSFSVSYDAAAVPEPSTWLLMILGFGAVGVTMRRRWPARQQQPRLLVSASQGCYGLVSEADSSVVG